MRRIIRPRSARRATAVLSAVAPAWLVAGTQGGPAAAAPRGHRPAPAHPAAISLTSTADAGASDIVNLGAAGWEVQSSAVATQISTPGFNTSAWLPVSDDDAGAPGTEIEALAQNGKCPGDTALQPVNRSTDSPDSVFFSTNVQSCYGFLKAVGADTLPEFDVPWWWRTDFTPNLAAGQTATLIVNGVVGSTITNTSSSAVAFLLRADVRRGTASGGLLPGDDELQSSIWQNNDITLFPGESQTLTVSYDSADLGTNTPVITLSGWNVPQVNIPAPVP